MAVNSGFNLQELQEKTFHLEKTVEEKMTRWNT